MTDYISREAVLALLKDDREVCADSKAELKYIRADIRAIPAADVRTVVRGRWVTRPYMMGQTEYCSRCGENYGRKHNFCPNCGADMREDS